MKTLNRFFLFNLFVLLAGVGFTACSDDDDENFENSSDLYGMWEPAYAEGYEEYGGERDSWSYALNLSNEYDGYSRIEFDGDGYCYAYEYRSGSWRLEFTEEYYVRGNEIYVDGEPATIVRLTASELIMEMRETETYGGETGEYYEKVTYRKIN